MNSQFFWIFFPDEQKCVSSFIICTSIISFSCLITLAGTPSVVSNTPGECNLLALYLISAGKFLPVNHEVGCRAWVDCLYQAEEVPLSS